MHFIVKLKIIPQFLGFFKIMIKYYFILDHLTSKI